MNEENDPSLHSRAGKSSIPQLERERSAATNNFFELD